MLAFVTRRGVCAPGSAMARARQEGSSPEPVEGLARDSPRPFPLGRLMPSAVSCSLCEPGLPAAPAAPALLPAAYLCAPTAPPAVTAALGGPRWPGGHRSRPRGPRPDGPQPSLSPAQQHLESPVPSAPEALAGGPTQAAPGVRVEEEEWAREIGAQLRRMADDLNAQYERRRQEEQHRHRPSPWRVMYNLFMGLLPLPRDPGAPEMEPN
ncbi:bcl-2-binding component 3 isoform b [Mus musculus]|nr:bcl-2-binding component 3 isoform b [Mus musculus]XP_021022663.1 bcl-2-binding component 3 isoform X1 [Mus caroli]|eukprot:XP_006539638.1 PREDICTED: bcl-2-binding component 3 isoform X1 [Mus musculus]